MARPRSLREITGFVLRTPTVAAVAAAGTVAVVLAFAVFPAVDQNPDTAPQGTALPAPPAAAVPPTQPAPPPSQPPAELAFAATEVPPPPPPTIAPTPTPRVVSPPTPTEAATTERTRPQGDARSPARPPDPPRLGAVTLASSRPAARRLTPTTANRPAGRTSDPLDGRASPTPTAEPTPRAAQPRRQRPTPTTAPDDATTTRRASAEDGARPAALNNRWGRPGAGDRPRSTGRSAPTGRRDSADRNDDRERDAASRPGNPPTRPGSRDDRDSRGNPGNQNERDDRNGSPNRSRADDRDKPPPLRDNDRDRER